MKISKTVTIILSIILVSAILLTACQSKVGESDLLGDKSDESAGTATSGADGTPADIDLVAEDEVEIGELI